MAQKKSEIKIQIIKTTTIEKNMIHSGIEVDVHFSGQIQTFTNEEKGNIKNKLKRLLETM